MPELPEVETMRRGIADVVGSVIVDVERVPCERKPILISPRIATLRRRVVGQAVVTVDRVGKRVLLRLESGDALIFEPRMTGLVLLADPPSVEHLRMQLMFDRSPSSLWYWDRRGLGSVRLLTATQQQQQLGTHKLGPDALAITEDDLRTRLQGSRRAIKVALLDQKVVAGVGNLYASELLHLAAVHPAKRCDQLTRADWRAVHQQMLHVLHEAIRYEGSTLSDGTYRNALNQAGGYQNQHRVYDREGADCPSCRNGRIERIVQTQRSTFFCKSCQPRRGRRREVVQGD